MEGMRKKEGEKRWGMEDGFCKEGVFEFVERVGFVVRKGE